MPSGGSAAAAGCRRVRGSWCAISGMCDSSVQSGQHLYTYPANGIVVIAALGSLHGLGGLLLALRGGLGLMSTSMVYSPVHTSSFCTISSHLGLHSPLMPIAWTRFSPHAAPIESFAVVCLVDSPRPLSPVCRRLAHRRHRLAHHHCRLALDRLARPAHCC